MLRSNKITNFKKVESDIDHEAEVQEITAARNPMKNNKAVYVTCNQTLALINGFEKKLNKEEPTELW